MRFSDLTDAGRLGEITGGSICTLILLGNAGVLLLSGRKSAAPPPPGPADREHPLGQSEGAPSRDATDAKPGAAADNGGR
ncbi:hypothetical protein FRUB_03936 [Fimbriiglobus ruber]|uniref:Uncharacterized protein n=1 Tax=Fimbriiglobus ruber TaxID=1908690 RepID=A0A225DTJ0_9BACT|nr:hypothetical protein FRUB_03936 [Fimbriiglobus ruber]